MLLALWLLHQGLIELNDQLPEEYLTDHSFAQADDITKLDRQERKLTCR